MKLKIQAKAFTLRRDLEKGGSFERGGNAEVMIYDLNEALDDANIPLWTISNCQVTIHIPKPGDSIVIHTVNDG